MIRPYHPEDHPALLALFQHLVPEYFAPAEEADYRHYLNHEAEGYFVAETEGRIIAAGGLNQAPEAGVMRLAWDLVHSQCHGQGWGSQLIQHRLAQLQQRSDIHTIEVRSSQLAYRFYQRQGFTLCQVEKDYWAPGFDLYRLRCPRPQG